LQYLQYNQVDHRKSPSLLRQKNLYTHHHYKVSHQLFLKKFLYQATHLSVPRKEALDTLPALPQKERLTFKPGAYLENGDPIRSLFLPKNLRQKFLDIAADNTRRGLEMCGMLCGTPINNALFVRCLLIPDQKCTSDTCETENEEVMFDYCMKEDLLLLGWIHTHPTQTCFMSSRDLHTHAGYQVMMPESVAIVCAPKFQPS
ncbi:STAM-binding protein, partial [Fusarium globosum]